MTDDPFDDGKQLAFGVGMRGSTEKLAIQVADMSLSHLPIESVDFLCAGVPKQKRRIVGSHPEPDIPKASLAKVLQIGHPLQLAVANAHSHH